MPIRAIKDAVLIFLRGAVCIIVVNLIVEHSKNS
jgi:hypothetical protein